MSLTQEWAEVMPRLELSLDTAMKCTLCKDITPFMLSHCGGEAR